MNPGTAGDFGEDEVAGEGKKHPDAKDFQRVLAAQDHRPQPRRLQSGPAARQEIDRHRRDGEEMREAQHVEIGLVDRVHPLLDDARHDMTELRHVPGQRDEERRQKIRDTDAEQDARRQEWSHASGAAQRTPGAEHEQQLPGERIEEPDAVRISRQIEIELPGERVERHRQPQREIWLALHQPQDRRQEQHQHDIERQHVHVDRAKLQQQRLHDGDIGLFEKIEDAHFFGVERVLEAGGDVGNLGQEDREQEDVGDIDLPDPLEDASARHYEAAVGHGAAVDESRRIARDENEDFGGVAEAVVTDRQPGEQVGRQVIDEDQPQRQTAKQVKTQFALAGGRTADGTRRLSSRGRRRRRAILCGTLREAAGGLVGNGRHRFREPESWICARLNLGESTARQRHSS